jgi:hypothetical protein
LALVLALVVVVIAGIVGWIAVGNSKADTEKVYFPRTMRLTTGLIVRNIPEPFHLTLDSGHSQSDLIIGNATVNYTARIQLAAANEYGEANVTATLYVGTDVAREISSRFRAAFRNASRLSVAGRTILVADSHVAPSGTCMPSAIGIDRTPATTWYLLEPTAEDAAISFKAVGVSLGTAEQLLSRLTYMSREVPCSRNANGSASRCVSQQSPSADYPSAVLRDVVATGTAESYRWMLAEEQDSSRSWFEFDLGSMVSFDFCHRFSSQRLQPLLGTQPLSNGRWIAVAIVPGRVADDKFLAAPGTTIIRNSTVFGAKPSLTVLFTIFRSSCSKSCHPISLEAPSTRGLVTNFAVPFNRYELVPNWYKEMRI